MVSVTTVALMQPCQGDAVCFYAKANALYLAFRKVDAIGNHWLRFVSTEQHNPNVRICETHFMDNSFVNLGEYKAGCAQRLFLKKKGSIPTLLWQSGASESATVSIKYCLNRGLYTANTYEHHHRVCHATLFPFRAWTDGKTDDIINCLYIYFESWNSWLW